MQKQFVLFAKSYNSTPSVLVTANHRTDNGNLAPVHNGITAWIENMNSTGFRACLKELYETRYDPVSLSYAVLTVKKRAMYFCRSWNSIAL